ncbi:MAG: amino acid permease [Oscillospiraceae bacterium]
MSELKQKYGLFTAIAMIVGVCIGSGIFFKSDNILIATNGSISLGVLMFAVAAISVVFGGLTVSYLAQKTDKSGGIITYAEEFCSKKTACVFGWFQAFIYYPALVAVVAWVLGVYVCILFNMPAIFEIQMLIGGIFCAVCFIYNVFLASVGGILQNVATVIKLVPLILIALFGFAWGNPMAALENISAEPIMGIGWLAAVGPVAFSFDGWIISTSLAHEIKNSKKNMSIALIVAPIIIFVVYVVYFVGITSYVGVDTVIAMGDNHVAYAAAKMFGDLFAKAITIFIIISVMGTINGVVMGYIRIPYSLALRDKMIPLQEKLKKVNPKLDIPVNSAVFAFCTVVIWGIIHYITHKFSLLKNSDVSEISIAVSYLLYIVIYMSVIRHNYKSAQKSIFKGYVCPVLATLGSVLILVGVMQNVLFVFYAMLSFMVILVSIFYYNHKSVGF